MGSREVFPIILIVFVALALPDARGRHVPGGEPSEGEARDHQSSSSVVFHAHAPDHAQSPTGLNDNKNFLYGGGIGGFAGIGGFTGLGGGGLPLMGGLGGLGKYGGIGGAAGIGGFKNLGGLGGLGGGIGGAHGVGGGVGVVPHP